MPAGPERRTYPFLVTRARSTSRSANVRVLLWRFPLRADFDIADPNFGAAVIGVIISL